jgi:PhnB protein
VPFGTFVVKFIEPFVEIPSTGNPHRLFKRSVPAEPIKEDIMQMNPYLNFDGTCEEALTFYAKVLGGEIVAMFKGKDTPMADKMPPEGLDRVMHGRISVKGNLLMASDVPPQFKKDMQGFSVSITVEDPAEAEQVFGALSEGAQSVQMPLQETFWAWKFGMFVDRYGTPWMINCEKPM